MDLPTPAPSIRDMADLATPMSIRVVATLSLVERAGRVGATAQQLASETGTSAPALRRLLDHLVTIGVFELNPQSSRYQPTNLGIQMSQDAPDGVKPCSTSTAPAAAPTRLRRTARDDHHGRPRLPHRYGRDFWAGLGTRPELRRSFDAQMHWRFQAQAPQIAEPFNWSRFSRILDVGGGDGTVLIAILHAHPDLLGQVLDLPPTATTAADRFAAAGLGDRAGAAEFGLVIRDRAVGTMAVLS